MAIDLQVELTDLRRAILTMAATVEQRVSRVITALLNQDLELAKKVRHGDREIDEMEIDIEAECLRILALSHPVAGDLRFVLSVMRINTDLERAADVAKGIAKRVIHLDRSTTVQSPQALAEMGAAAQEMFSNAVGALANEDTDLCRRIRRSDDRVDDLQREVIVWAQSEVPHHVDWLDAAIDILSIAKNLERIGDLATNIAEDVVFLIEGAVIRHTKV
jgi:phosphate transport system protein